MRRRRARRGAAAGDAERRRGRVAAEGPQRLVIEAALAGASEIGFTIISLTVSLIAVLIPLLFMGDVVGRLFREFAVTLAITILISAVVSLTLVPMMSARWLQAARRRATRAHGLGARLRAASSASIDRYDHALHLGDRPRAADAAGRAGDAGRSPCCSTCSFPRACSRPRTPASCRRASRPPHDVSYARMAELQQAAARRDAAGPGGRERSARSSASTRPTTPCCTPAAC